ncbi:MAG: hypothetical protein Q9168_003211 [Polycauliona sp. 1 TL-2023]
MIVAIIRVTLVDSEIQNIDYAIPDTAKGIGGKDTQKFPENIDISWLYFWSCIEMTTAIIIACVASFRQFFVTTNKQRQENKPAGSKPRKRLPLWPGRQRNRLESSDGLENDLVGANEMDKHDHIVPLDSIHVGYRISVLPGNFKEDEHRGQDWPLLSK